MLKTTIRKQSAPLKNGPKTLTDTSLKKICRWQIGLWKLCYRGMKMQTTTRYHCSFVRIVKISTPTPPIAGEIWSSRNSYSLLMAMQSGTATLEDSLMVFYHTKYSLSLWFIVLAQRSWKLMSAQKPTQMLIAALYS